MKKKINRLCLLLFISLLPTALFSSCDKDTNCYLDVLVVDENTKAPISGAIVELYQNNCDPSDYNYRNGATGADGIYSTFFEAPGIFSVKASLNLAEGDEDSHGNPHQRRLLLIIPTKHDIYPQKRRPGSTQ